jgi:hypothetical protein
LHFLEHLKRGIYRIAQAYGGARAATKPSSWYHNSLSAASVSRDYLSRCEFNLNCASKYAMGGGQVEIDNGASSVFL